MERWWLMCQDLLSWNSGRVGTDWNDGRLDWVREQTGPSAQSPTTHQLSNCISSLIITYFSYYLLPFHLFPSLHPLTLFSLPATYINHLRLIMLPNYSPLYHRIYITPALCLPHSLSSFNLSNYVISCLSFPCLLNHHCYSAALSVILYYSLYALIGPSLPLVH